MGLGECGVRYRLRLFRIPMGELGDRIGPGSAPTGIVLRWSGFTVLTGAMMRLPVLAVFPGHR
jgi:hypothetical protein